MIHRRSLLCAATMLAAAPNLGHAQSWKAAYPELVFAVIPAENASGVLNRYGPFIEYMSRVLGTKVTLRIANDYAAVIEGQRAGNIHIGNYGPSAFARALMTGAPIEAFAIEVNLDGTKGYHSVFYVRQDSAFQRIEDLKPDLNSAHAQLVEKTRVNQADGDL